MTHEPFNAAEASALWGDAGALLSEARLVDPAATLALVLDRYKAQLDGNQDVAEALLERIRHASELSTTVGTLLRAFGTAVSREDMSSVRGVTAALKALATQEFANMGEDAS